MQSSRLQHGSFLPHAFNFLQCLPLGLRNHIVDGENGNNANSSKNKIGVARANAILQGWQDQADLHSGMYQGEALEISQYMRFCSLAAVYSCTEVH